MAFKTDRVDVTSVEGLIGGAFAAGAVTGYQVGLPGALSVQAKMHGKCENPIEVYRAGGFVPPSGEVSEVRSVNGTDRRAIAVTLRCRQCPSCLRNRAAHWSKLATMEMLATPGRTWFGTMTLSPEEQARAAYSAMARYGVESFARLSPEEQLPLRHAAVNRSFTLALKRLRKRYGERSFRYLLVCEAHESGLPHYHMLLHESAQNTPIRKSALNDFWPLGFSKWRVAEMYHAAYTAKYLSKDAKARVRASRRYGSGIHETAFARRAAQAAPDYATLFPQLVAQRPAEAGASPRVSAVGPASETTGLG